MNAIFFGRVFDGKIITELSNEWIVIELPFVSCLVCKRTKKKFVTNEDANPGIGIDWNVDFAI
jgi:hypothetical protein